MKRISKIIIVIFLFAIVVILYKNINTTKVLTEDSIKDAVEQIAPIEKLSLTSSETSCVFYIQTKNKQMPC